LVRGECRGKRFVFSVEEGLKDSGIGSIISQQLGIPVEFIGLPAEFIPHGSRSLLLEKCGLDAERIAARIREVIKNNG
jgi:1-deoxy-D-xylulose-5-phosphate synthase